MFNTAVQACSRHLCKYGEAQTKQTSRNEGRTLARRGCYGITLRVSKFTEYPITCNPVGCNNTESQINYRRLRVYEWLEPLRRQRANSAGHIQCWIFVACLTIPLAEAPTVTRGKLTICKERKIEENTPLAEQDGQIKAIPSNQPLAAATCYQPYGGDEHQRQVTIVRQSSRVHLLLALAGRVGFILLLLLRKPLVSQCSSDRDASGRIHVQQLRQQVHCLLADSGPCIHGP